MLSESFGSNPVPNPANDPVAVFNTLAVQHGITVLASSGDAGVTNTIGTPAASTGGVIATGATTAFRLQAQVSQDGYQLGGDRGYESGNVATLSSSGFTDYGPNSVDVVAPGDAGWAVCSKAPRIFTECAPQLGGSQRTPGLLSFAGTSEACPLTAGVAALVIQAYRDTHRGATPTPQLVKKIITSTANDLGLPVQEQGAGQVNSRRAVQLARSYATRTPTGVTTVFAPNKITTVAAPGSTTERNVFVHNTSATTRTISPVLQEFTGPRTIASGTVAYQPGVSAPTFAFFADGSRVTYVQRYFTVPAGYQRLNVRFGFPADATKRYVLFEELFDPAGRLAQDSNPQTKTVGFGQGDVRNPQPGRWRVVFFAFSLGDHYRGPISYQATVQRRVPATTGSVTPARLTLRPNAVGTVRVRFRNPASAGDSSAEISFGDRIGVLPILRRSYATPTRTRPATFSGVITTGNGRMVTPSQELPFQFSVPAGVKDVDVDVHVAAAGYVVAGFLDATHASAVDMSTTSFVDVTKASSPTTAGQDLHLSWQRPVPGRWGIVLATIGGSSSGRVATTVTGRISFDTARVTSTGVPHAPTTTLIAGVTHRAGVTVTNTGSAPKIYFIDPRRAGQTTYPLGFVGSQTARLPITDSPPQAVVPPATTELTMIAHSNRPASLTMSPTMFATPEIDGTSGLSAVASYATRYVPATVWGCNAASVGPFREPVKGATVSCDAFAATGTIDDAVQATGGNLWDSFTDPHSRNTYDRTEAVVVQPGQSTTLQVSFTPSAAERGTTVRGYLAVQSLDAYLLSGDDLKHVPYAFKVAASQP